ncbi:hypothetical protein KBZ15_17670, partial [Cyanobium sp. BA20m-p-22]|uniref:PilW family protein n=1 Tax=Cyanobium sp. BA20m-p-22 TaxID=2823704 RepID=UPI0020CBF42A
MKKPQSRHLPFALSGSDTGFTLVELAVGTAVGALVIIITTAVFAPLLRLHKQLDSQIRLQERWSRVQFLLNSEIQEAESVNYISNGLRIVNSSGSIEYIWDPGKQILNRSGPGIDCHGELRLGGQGA